MRYVCNHLIDFDEICIVMHIRPSNLTANQKFQNFKILDGGRRPSWKSKNCDISKTVWPMLLKFRTITHISSPELTSCSKKLSFKNPRWWRATILIIAKCDISVIIWLILMKFMWRCTLVVLTRSATKNLIT